MKSRRPPLFPILLVNFIGTLGFSIVIPFLVYLVTRFGGNAVVYGIVGATYPTFQLIGSPMLGRWSDRIGRRRTLLISQLGTLAAWLLFALALALPMRQLVELGGFALSLPLAVLFAARALDGLTGGNISVANAYLADITEESERSKNFGRMGVSSNLGFVIGPALATVLGALADPERAAVWFAIGISAVASVLIWRLLPESQPCTTLAPHRRGMRRTAGHEPVDCTRVEAARRSGLREVLAQPAVARLLVLYFLVFLAFSQFYVSFPVRAAGDLGWSVGRTGTFFATLSVAMVLVQGPLLSWLSPRVPERLLIFAGSLSLGVAFFMLTSTDLVVIFSAALFFALGNGTMWPTLQSVLSRAASPTLQGATQGYAGAVGSLANIAGLLVGGVVYARFGGWSFVGAAATMGLVALLASLWCRVAPRS